MIQLLTVANPDPPLLTAAEDAAAPRKIEVDL